MATNTTAKPAMLQINTQQGTPDDDVKSLDSDTIANSPSPATTPSPRQTRSGQADLTFSLAALKDKPLDMNETWMAVVAEGSGQVLRFSAPSSQIVSFSRSSRSSAFDKLRRILFRMTLTPQCVSTTTGDMKEAMQLLIGVQTHPKSSKLAVNIDQVMGVIARYREAIACAYIVYTAPIDMSSWLSVAQQQSICENTLHTTRWNFIDALAKLIVENDSILRKIRIG
ncbi:MAG: hypothetical protein M1833_004268 [Piccolia ochrophora]|nr:MAG: hypothetical protein M1833_004268 [Piccolia ochrophora]